MYYDCVCRGRRADSRRMDFDARHDSLVNVGQLGGS